MVKIIKGMCVVLIVLVSRFASAENLKSKSYGRSFEVYGTGGLSCGAWVESRRTNHQDQQNLYRQWMAGWIVSYNYYSERGRLNQVSTPEFDTMSLWLDTYCQNNPTDNVAFATVALVEKLGGASALHQWK